MTADVELLPLPEWMSGFQIPSDDFDCDGDHRLSDRMRDYARANVEHRTEALRAVVLHLRTDNSESFRDAAILANIRRDEAEARAERLAEALRRIEGLEPAEFNEPETLGLAAMGIAHGALLRDQARGKGVAGG